MFRIMIIASQCDASELLLVLGCILLAVVVEAQVLAGPRARVDIGQGFRAATSSTNRSTTTTSQLESGGVLDQFCAGLVHLRQFKTAKSSLFVLH
eukprot:942424-Rhodomonas_salina.1